MDCSIQGCFSVVLFFLVIKSVYAACTPVEEGKSTVLHCTIHLGDSCPRPGNDVLFWGISSDFVSSGHINLASCNRTSCTTISPTIFGATVTRGSGPTYVSSLTISSVLRNYSTSLETQWNCTATTECGGEKESVCDKLEVYALPQDPTCVVEDIFERDGDMLLTVICYTNKVYPQADCLFYHYKESQQIGGALHTSGIQTAETFSDPIYYSYKCDVEYSVVDLGVGHHTFCGRMYPRVIGGDCLTGVVDTTECGDVDLYLPETMFACTTELKEGYFKGKSANCTCILPVVGNPKGTPRWYKNADELHHYGDTLIFTYDDLDQTKYTCRGTSALGEGPGSMLVPKFAFFDPDSVEVKTSGATITMCNNNNNNNVISITCRISKGRVHPGVNVYFSEDSGKTFIAPRHTEESGGYYQAYYNFEPNQGGVYQVVCRVVNSIFSDLKEEKASGYLMFYESPSLAPEITIDDQTYQGTDSGTQSATLIDGYPGNITCKVTGGYPAVDIIRLECGSLSVESSNGTCSLSFKMVHLTRNMDGVTCSCTAKHMTGCYGLETSVALNVHYIPRVAMGSTRIHLDEGQSTTLTCESVGNPPPYLSLTRERTGDVLLSHAPSGNKTTTLDILLNNVKCLDTDTYSCAASNRYGANTSSVKIFVRCAPQISETITHTRTIDASIGETVAFSITIYGYPKPTDLTLRRLISGRFESAPVCHTVVYSASAPPYGSVEVNLTNITSKDFTAYILTVDNDVGDMVYHFIVNQVKNETTPSTESSSDDSVSSLTLVVMVLALGGLVFLLSGAVLFLLRRSCRAKENHTSTYLYPIEYASPDNVSAESHQGHQQPPSWIYETIDLSYNYINQSALDSTLHDLDPSYGNELDRSERAPYESTVDQDVEPPNVYQRMSQLESLGNSDDTRNPPIQ